MTNTEMPESEQDIAAVVKDAQAAKTPIEIVGGGTRNGLGHSVLVDTVLSTQNHSGISLYEPDALTLVAKAGTRLEDIEKLLGDNGQRLPFEPMHHKALFGTEGHSTIGGVVACNISGPRRIQAGACRDSLIGVRFVNGNGGVIKNGGRVMKNVTGLDLVKLLCGSHGTLGVLTEVSFKVLPIAERQATLAITGLSVTDAVSVLSRTLSSPFDITGAAHLPGHDSGPLTIIRVEGFHNQVDYRLSGLKNEVAANSSSTIIEGNKHEALWQNICDVEPFKGHENPVWRVSTTPGNAPAIHDAISKQCDAEFVFDWGGGLIWISLASTDPVEVGYVRNIVEGISGHATLIRAPESMKNTIPVFQPQSKPVAQLSNAIRQKFDPGGILNPGRMTGAGH